MFFFVLLKSEQFASVSAFPPPSIMLRDPFFEHSLYCDGGESSRNFEIGRRGEELALSFVCPLYEQITGERAGAALSLVGEKLCDGNVTIASVYWVNVEEETGEPYDIVIERLGRPDVYIEGQPCFELVLCCS